MLESTSQPSSSHGPGSSPPPNRHHRQSHPPSHRQQLPQAHHSPPPLMYGPGAYPPHPGTPPMYFGNGGYLPNGSFQQPGSIPPGGVYYSYMNQPPHYYPSTSTSPHTPYSGQLSSPRFGNSYNSQLSSRTATQGLALSTGQSPQNANISLPNGSSSPTVRFVPLSPSGARLTLPMKGAPMLVPPLLPPMSPFPLQTTMSPPLLSAVLSHGPSSPSQHRGSRSPSSRQSRSSSPRQRSRTDSLPRLDYVISLTRPADPSTAFGLTVSPNAKPPIDFVNGAMLVFHDDGTTAKAIETSTKEGSDSENVLSGDVPDSIPESLPTAGAVATGPSSDVDAEPSTKDSLSSSVTSSSISSAATASTTTTHTPSPSSPVSTSTSLSAAAASFISTSSTAVTTPATSTMSSPITPNTSTLKSAISPKPMVKSWADLVKGKNKATSPKVEETPSSITESPDEKTPVKAPIIASSVVGVSIPAQDAPAPPSPPTSPKSPSRTLRPPTNSRGSVSSSTPLHVLLTTPSPQSAPAVLTQPRGLVNTGNICFANVVLQALLYSAPFYTLFHEIGMRLPADLARNGLVDATVLFLREFDLASDAPHPQLKPKQKETSGTSTPSVTDQVWQQEALIPEFLYDAMKENKRFDLMRRGHQEDAEEFLGFFLDTLHEEFLTILSRLQANPTPASAAWAASSNATVPGEDLEREVQRPVSPPGDRDVDGEGWLEVGRKNKATMTRTTKARESVITRTFGGKLRSVLRTPGAKDSVTLEPYQPLQLDIQSDRVATIEDALLHLTEPETVQVHSTARSGVVDATKQVFVETLPPILVLHLKRFLYDAVGGVQKSHKVVSYGTTLDIPTDVLSPAQRSHRTIRYKLYGVVYHHGKFATGGHYTIDALRQDHSEWIRIDDTNIETIAESDVAVSGYSNSSDSADKVAYLLFYQRVVEEVSPRKKSGSSRT